MTDNLDTLIDRAARGVLLRSEGPALRAAVTALQFELTTAKAETTRWLAFIERGITEHLRFSMLHTDGTTELMPCADWCYACKLEKAEAGR